MQRGGAQGGQIDFLRKRFKYLKNTFLGFSITVLMKKEEIMFLII